MNSLDFHMPNAAVHLDDDNAAAATSFPAESKPSFEDLLNMLAEEHQSALAKLQAQIQGGSSQSLSLHRSCENPELQDRPSKSRDLLLLSVPFSGSQPGGFSGIVPQPDVGKQESRFPTTAMGAQRGEGENAVGNVYGQAATPSAEEQVCEGNHGSTLKPDARVARAEGSLVSHGESILKGIVADPPAGEQPTLHPKSPRHSCNSPSRQSWNRQLSGDSSACDDKDGRVMSKVRRAAALFDEARAKVQLVSTIRTFLDRPESSLAAFLWAKFWILVVLASACMPLLQMMLILPVQECTSVEIIFEVCFLAELTMRLATCRFIEAFVRSPYFVLDALAFLPLVLRPAAGNSTSIEENPVQLGLLLFTPILRLQKFMRPFSFLCNIFGEVVNMTKGALIFLLLWLFIIVLIASSSLYIAEPRSNLEDYTRCIWLALVTMTTVGYGDKVPETLAGELILYNLMIVSFLFLAIPVGILGNAFTQVWADRDRLTIVWTAIEMMREKRMKTKHIPEFFSQFDPDQDGAIGLDEFKRMSDHMQSGLDESRLTKLFQRIDKDGSHSIDQKEFVQAFFPEAYSRLYGKLDSKSQIVPN